MLRLFIPLTLPLALAAAGQDATPAPAAPTVQDAPAATDIAIQDAGNRLTVPVAIGASGPFRFIIDTGAERTVVSRELATSLSLPPGRRLKLVSMTEQSQVETVQVRDLSVQPLGPRHHLEAPMLESRHLGAQGLLGIDTLAEHRVTIDFEAGQMRVEPSRKRSARRARDDEIVVTARSRFGQLIVTDARVDNIPVRVVIDTGSQVTMGNSALRRLARVRKEGVQAIRLTSVTGGTTTADYTVLPLVRIGSVRLDQMPVAFADVEPFRQFGLMRRPALLLGMDTLRLFRRVEIDFPNRQVRLLLPDGVRGAESPWRLL
ncbi:MAG: retroviral-like aspartic protease family protein [Pseudomonadota bacterium]